MKDICYLVIIISSEGGNLDGNEMVSNKEIQNLEAMSQLLEAQGRKLRELEITLQREKQEKANLEMDFHHLLDQLNSIACMPQL